MTTPPPYCSCPLREGATGHKRDGAHAPRPNTTTPRGVILALNSPPCYDEDSIFPLLAQFSSQQSLHRFQQCTPSHWSMRRERKKIGTKKKPPHHSTSHHWCWFAKETRTFIAHKCLGQKHKLTLKQYNLWWMHYCSCDILVTANSFFLNAARDNQCMFDQERSESSWVLTSLGALKFALTWHLCQR